MPNPAAEMVVDHYDDDDWSALWCVRMTGPACALGGDTAWAVDLLCQKYAQYGPTPRPAPSWCCRSCAGRGGRSRPCRGLDSEAASYTGWRGLCGDWEPGRRASRLHVDREERSPAP